MSSMDHAFKRALKHPSFVAGSAMVFLLVVSAVLSMFWSPYPVGDIDIPNKLAASSAQHWFGTDSLGRDIAALLLVGSQNSLLVGFIAVGIGLGAGVPLGLLASAKRGWVEEVVMRAADFTFAFPALLSAILLTSIYGPGLVVSITAIGIFNIPVFARITRGAANSVWVRDYTQCCQRAHCSSHGAICDCHFGRGCLVVFRIGHTTPSTQLGPHAERGAITNVSSPHVGGLSRCGHCTGCAGLESHGRWPS